MNSLRHLLNTAAGLGALVSCLLALHTPALAFGIYTSNSILTVGGGSQPNGPVFGPGTTFTAPGIGSASAEVLFDPLLSGFPQCPCAHLQATADGAASGPPVVASLGIASAVGTLGPGASAGDIVLPIIATWALGAAVVNPAGGSETAHASFKFSIQVDGIEVFGHTRGFTVSDERVAFADPPSELLTLPLVFGPGFHSLLITAQANGFADVSAAPAPVPEPTTLLLVGTTAAGLGLARWRRHRRKQRVPR